MDAICGVVVISNLTVCDGDGVSSIFLAVMRCSLFFFAVLRCSGPPMSPSLSFPRNDAKLRVMTNDI